VAILLNSVCKQVVCFPDWERHHGRLHRNLLKARGLKVNLQKCDPYLNVDAGLLNPREHGECFVTKDGAETDLDLGHYERFVDEEMTSASSLMTAAYCSNLSRTSEQASSKVTTCNYPQPHGVLSRIGSSMLARL